MTLISTTWHCISYIGVGAGPAGLVLAGPLFRWFNEIHYRYLHARRYRRCAICACLLQPDHFKSHSYVPVLSGDKAHQPSSFGFPKQKICLTISYESWFLMVKKNGWKILTLYVETSSCWMHGHLTPRELPVVQWVEKWFIVQTQHSCFYFPLLLPPIQTHPALLSTRPLPLSQCVRETRSTSPVHQPATPSPLSRGSWMVSLRHSHRKTVWPSIKLRTNSWASYKEMFPLC